MTVYKGNDFSVERTEKEIINPNPFHYIYIVFRKHTHMNNVRVHIKLYRLLDSSSIKMLDPTIPCLFSRTKNMKK